MLTKSAHTYLLVVPLIFGAYASGLVYLAEQSAIPITLFQLALVLSVGGFFALKFLQVDAKFEVYGMEKWYLLFLGIIFISCIYTPERQQAIFYAIRFTVLLGMTYIIYNILQQINQVQIALLSIVVSALLVALVNLYQIYANPEILAFNYIKQGVRIIRSTGAESDPNVFASNFFTPILLCVAWIGHTRKKWLRGLLFAVAGLMLASVILSYSRSAWISIIIGVLLIQFYQRKNPFIMYGLLALVLVIVISPTVQNLILSLWDRIIGLFTGGGDDSTKFRVVLASAALTMIADSYLLGVGFQGFSTYFQYLYPPQETQWIFEPHNDFYMVFAELGLVGFILFVLMMFLIFRQALESMKLFKRLGDSETEQIRSDISSQAYFLQSTSLGLMASFLSYMIFAQFISGLMLNGIFMILVALIFSVSKFAQFKTESALS